MQNPNVPLTMASLSLFSDAFGLGASTGLAATGTKLPELTCVTVACHIHYELH